MRTVWKHPLAIVFGSAFIATTAQGQERNNEEVRAIAAIHEWRGGVILDHSKPGKPVIEVDVRETEITDADLALLKPLTSLRKLELGMTGIGDAGIVHLKELTNLEELSLGGESTGAGIVHLKGLPKLCKLSLCNTMIENDELILLQQLRQLEELDLQDNRLTNRGLPNLSSTSPI
jgi:internalin A